MLFRGELLIGCDNDEARRLADHFAELDAELRWQDDPWRSPLATTGNTQLLYRSGDLSNSTARGTFNGKELRDVPAIHPGGWIGKSWCILNQQGSNHVRHRIGQA
jgi:hypothetical protein